MIQQQTADGVYSDFAGNLGQSIHNHNNALAHFNTVAISITDLEELAKNWLYDRATSKIVHEAMRKGYYIEGLSAADTQKLSQEIARLGIDTITQQALVSARMFSNVFVLRGTNAPTFEKQVPANEKTLFLMVEKAKFFSKQRGSALLPLSATMGKKNKPITYTYKPNNQPMSVHHTHLLEVENIGSDGTAQSIITKIKSAADNFICTSKEIAALVSDAKTDVIKTPDLAQKLLANPNETIARYASIGQLKGNTGLMVLDGEEDYASKHYAFGGLTDIVASFERHVATALDIPHSILFGRSGGLAQASDTDLASWYDNVQAYQQNEVTPLLQRLIALACINVFGQPKELQIHFNPLQQLDEKTRSEVEKNNATRDQMYLEMGIVNEATVANQLIEDKTYTNFDPKQLAALQAVSE